MTCLLQLTARVGFMGCRLIDNNISVCNFDRSRRSECHWMDTEPGGEWPLVTFLRARLILGFDRSVGGACVCVCTVCVLAQGDGDNNENSSCPAPVSVCNDNAHCIFPLYRNLRYVLCTQEWQKLCGKRGHWPVSRRQYLYSVAGCIWASMAATGRSWKFL